MFTGIVAAVGRITGVEARPGGLHLQIDAGSLAMEDVALGDSICVNGVCLTVVRMAGQGFAVDVSDETLLCTVGLDAPGEVNLEKALRLADRLGGHLVSGHVDGMGEVARFEPEGESWRLKVRAPEPLAPYLARKGSVTVQGVSLTINAVDDACFEVNLIPHTLAMTTLQHLRVGSRVNLEVDQVARYVERILSLRAG